MSARMPVWGREAIDGLRLRESFRAIGDSVQPRTVHATGIWWAAGKNPERDVGGLLEDAKRYCRNGDNYRQ
jgi:hypothetical protein